MPRESSRRAALVFMAGSPPLPEERRDGTFPYLPAFAGSFLIVSRSMLTFTSSPSTTPPLSRAWLKLTPKSLRLIVTEVEKPAWTLPRWSLIWPEYVTGSVTYLLTPCMVNVPVTSNVFSPVDLTDLLLKVISGNFSTSKKSAERRCLSRSGWLVSMLAALILKSTEEAGRFLGSISTVPENSLNRPRAWLTKWRTWNPISEWTVSTANVSAWSGRVARAERATAANSLRFMTIPP